MKVIAINGSHHKDGDIAFLLNIILTDLKEKGAETKLYNAHDAILSCKSPFCTSCSSPCSRACFSRELTEIFDNMEDADAIVFGSPVYFGTMCGQLKCLFDKTRSLRGKNALLGKIGLAVSCGASKYGGQEATLRAIQDSMLVDGMTIIGTSSSALAGHQGVSATHPSKDDEFAISRAHSAATRIYEELTKQKRCFD